MAKETGCEFLDAAFYAEPSEMDGLHMTQESHKRPGLAIAQKVRECWKAKAREVYNYEFNTKSPSNGYFLK